MDAAALLAALRDTPTAKLEASFRELDTLENSDRRVQAPRPLGARRTRRRPRGRHPRHGWLGDLDHAGDEGSSARALVETTRALPDRPTISTAALEGRLSAEQLAAVVQVATPDTDAAWAADSPGWTATSLLAAARSQQTVTHEQAVERDRSRKLGYRWDERTR